MGPVIGILLEAKVREVSTVPPLGPSAFSFFKIDTIKRHYANQTTVPSRRLLRALWNPPGLSFAAVVLGLAAPASSER